MAIANTQSVHKVRQNQAVENEMDIKIFESFEKDDPSEDTLRLTTRWKEIVKPGDYQFTQGQWKMYAPLEHYGQCESGLKSNYG